MVYCFCASCWAFPMKDEVVSGILYWSDLTCRGVLEKYAVHCDSEQQCGPVLHLRRATQDWWLAASAWFTLLWRDLKNCTLHSLAQNLHAQPGSFQYNCCRSGDLKSLWFSCTAMHIFMSFVMISLIKGYELNGLMLGRGGLCMFFFFLIVIKCWEACTCNVVSHEIVNVLQCFCCNLYERKKPTTAWK